MVKRIIFPGTTLIASFYVSSIFAVGLILGYFGTEMFCRRYLQTGKINSVIFKVGSWEIHLHHWITGGLVVFGTYLSNILLPIFFLGTLSGLIFHDLHTDKGWYKVVYKQKARL